MEGILKHVNCVQNVLFRLNVPKEQQHSRPMDPRSSRIYKVPCSVEMAGEECYNVMEKDEELVKNLKHISTFKASCVPATLFNDPDTQKVSL